VVEGEDLEFEEPGVDVDAEVLDAERDVPDAVRVVQLLLRPA